jgi:hypothetical protein
MCWVHSSRSARARPSLFTKYGPGGGGKLYLWRMIWPWRAKHLTSGAEVDPYRETPPVARDPGRKPPYASE